MGMSKIFTVTVLPLMFSSLSIISQEPLLVDCIDQDDDDDGAPTSLSYPTEKAEYVVGAQIPFNSPTVEGGSATSFSVAPSLPSGISLDTKTGVISGTATGESQEATYKVTAQNEFGSASSDLLISVISSTNSFSLEREDISTAYDIAPDIDNSDTLSFETGQDADIALAAVDFNNTGYLNEENDALFFNHQANCASNGTKVVLADRNNNRVLIWNTPPTGNTPPDLVLGQPDFTSNNPGDELNQLSWPVAVSVSKDGKLVVADTNNNRILVWNTFPTKTAQPADFEIESNIKWPWGIWTDGTKLAVSSTGSSQLFLWNTFPTTGTTSPSITITKQGMGTPRTVTSNGTFISVGDHNSTVAGNEGQMNFIWTSWPTQNDQAPSYYSKSISDANYAWMSGTFTSDNKLVMLGSTLAIWNTPPSTSAEFQAPSLVVGKSFNSGSADGFSFDGGDGSGVCVANERIYVSMANGNRLVTYSSLPTSSTQLPDDVIGSTSTTNNTLLDKYFITNSVSETDGNSLYVSSDFDKTLSVWSNLPDSSNTIPNYRFKLPFAPWDSALYENTFVLAGKESVMIWDTLPTFGAYPKTYIKNKIGSITLKDIIGVSWDGTHFALSMSDATNGGKNHIYIWEGIPTSTQEPIQTLEVKCAGRLNSYENYIVGTDECEPKAFVYDVTNKTLTDIKGIGRFNLPRYANIYDGKLFVADTSFNRIQIWDDWTEAASATTNTSEGWQSDIILGAADYSDVDAEIGQSKLFMPASLSFADGYLWAGEYKFSGRLLRYSVR